MRFDLAAWGAELTPERPAIWSGGRWLSYRELNERAVRLANYLDGTGIRYGDRVGLLAGNHLAHFDLMFAAAKLGFVPVAFDPQAPADALMAAARVADAQLVISDPRSETQAAQLFSCARIDLDEYRDLLGRASARPQPPLELSPESMHSLQFVKDPEGASRCVLIPYRQARANARATAIGWGLGPEDCTVLVAPCSEGRQHALAVPLLAVGGRVVIPDQPAPESLSQDVARHSVTVWSATGAQYAALAAHPGFDPRAGLCLRQAWVDDGAADPETAARFATAGVILKPGFFCAQAGFNVFELSEDEVRSGRPAFGRPLAHVDVTVADGEGRPCTNGQPGELSIGGEGLSAGYYDSALAWRESVSERRFRTGRRVVCGPDGCFRPADASSI